MKIGDTLKKLRQKRRLTLEDVALATGLSISYISCLERDKRNINFTTLEKIAKAISVPLPVIIFLSANDEDFNQGDATLTALQSTLTAYVLG